MTGHAAAIAGWTVCAWLATGLLGVAPGMRVALAALASIGLFSSAFVACLFAGIDHSGWIDCAVAAVSSLVLASLPSPRQRRAAGDGPSPMLVIWFVASCGIAMASALRMVALAPDGTEDAFIIWTLRGRWLARAGAEFASAFSPDILYWTHQDYPLLLPGALARLFVAAGSEPAVIPIAIAVLFGALAAALVALTAGALRGPRCGLLAGLAFVSTPVLPALTAGQLADVPLAAYLAAATSLSLLRSPGNPFMLAGVGFFASMGAWTKNEGILYFVLFGAAAVATEKTMRSVAFFLSGAMPALAIWLAFKTTHAPPNALMHSFDALERLLSLDRWQVLLLGMARRVVFFQRWGIHLVALLGFLLFERRRTRGMPLARHVGWIPVAGLGVLIPIYLLQPYDLAWMFRTTADRLLMQVWPTALILVFARQPSEEMPGSLTAPDGQQRPSPTRPG